VRELTPADLPDTLNTDLSSPPGTDPQKAIDAMIGLEPVKIHIAELAAEHAANILRRSAGVSPRAMNRNFLFTGAPGTGKTTVARHLAALYKQFGLLSRGHLVEHVGSDLVSQWVGATSSKTATIVQEAIGGVLFIDEAYTLATIGGHDDRGHAGEALATLLTHMDNPDHRGNLVIIFAGYPDEMRTLVESNSGLASRFNATINFPNYTDQELIQIFQQHAATEGYLLEDGITAQLANLVATAGRDRTFGNGRLMRHTLDATIARHGRRITAGAPPSRSGIRTLRVIDLPTNLPLRLFPAAGTTREPAGFRRPASPAGT
jgi:SpoVK/Ycf46/Vps4 family AAA+-type ATPase